jgi:hypothetical protein
MTDQEHEQVRAVVRPPMSLIEGRFARVEAKIDDYRQLLAGARPAMASQDGEQNEAQ